MKQLIPLPISGYILVSYNRQRPNLMSIASNSPFFKEPIKCNISNGCIIFKHANLEDKKIYNPSANRGEWRTFTIEINDITPGKYEFDADSNEDEVIITYK